MQRRSLFNMTKREANIKAAWIIWRYHPYAKGWGRSSIKQWVHWLLSEAFIIFVMDDQANNELVGMLVMRPMMKPEDYREICSFDQEGPTLFVDFAWSKHAYGLMSAGFAVLTRFGMRKTVAWNMDGKLKVYRAANLRRNLLRRVMQTEASK